MKRRWLCLASLLLLAGLAVPQAAAYRPRNVDKIDRALLERFAADGSADLVVRFAEQADLSPAFGMDWHDRGWFVYDTLREAAARSQAGAIDIVKGRRLDYRTFIAGNELYVEAGSLGLALELAALPAVAAVYAPSTYAVDPLLSGAAPGSPTALEWGIIDTKADQFWGAFGLQGEGIVVANVDTGVAYLHPALDQAYKCAADPGNSSCWFDPTGECGGVPCDPNGHGTATMGPMVADDDPTLPYQAGMAPGARWIACKACGQYGSCGEAQLNACADWLLAPGDNPDNRPHAVLNPWGGMGCNGWFQARVQAWVAAGIFPSFSVGASGPGCAVLASPADYQEAFATTAHGSSRDIASFAGRGPSCYGHDPYTKPNISAPGVNIRTPYPPDGWQIYNGTSFSAAFSPGAVALLWSCAPDLVGQVYATFEALQDAANTPPVGNCGAPPDGEGNYTYGYGYLDILAAGQSHCGPPLGRLDGHVYDAGTGSPIGGATVTALPGPVQDTTDSHGYYVMALVSGTYTVTAAAAGYFSATASVAIVDGVTTTQDFSLTLRPLPPAASFETSGPACPHEPVYFTDTSQADPPVTAWGWTFGDGGAASVPNPVYTYTAAGVFTVTLAVTNAVGSDAATQTVTVHRLPIASFTHAPAAGPAPLTVYFTDTSRYAEKPRWSFGDSYTATGTVVSHTYAMAGRYTATLRVDGAFGCGRAEATGIVVVGTPPPVAAFSFSPLSGCVPLAVQFYDESTGDPTAWGWTFGDGGTADVPEPIYTYMEVGDFTVRLVVTNAGGWDDVTHTVIIGELPAASFTYAPVAGPVPLTVYFTDTSRYAEKPRWSFGDSYTATGAVVSHTYALSGTYAVTLWVDSAFGCGPASAVGTVVARQEEPGYTIYLPALFKGYLP